VSTVRVVPAMLGAHLLAESGSAASRAWDLLKLAGLEELEEQLGRKVIAAVELLHGARLVLDAHLELALCNTAEQRDRALHLLQQGREMLDDPEEPGARG
jgi:hypothetical protein